MASSRRPCPTYRHSLVELVLHMFYLCTREQPPCIPRTTFQPFAIFVANSLTLSMLMVDYSEYMEGHVSRAIPTGSGYSLVQPTLPKSVSQKPFTCSNSMSSSILIRMKFALNWFSLSSTGSVGPITAQQG